MENGNRPYGRPPRERERKERGPSTPHGVMMALMRLKKMRQSS